MRELELVPVNYKLQRELFKADFISLKARVEEVEGGRDLNCM